MKVYVAEVFIDYECPSVAGVFSTLEQAQAACGDSPAEWRGDEDDWHRSEAMTEPLRVPDSYSTLGWQRRTLTIAPSAHVHAYELDVTLPVDVNWWSETRDDAQPMTEEDEQAWHAYVAEGLRNGTMVSTSVSLLSSSD